MIGIATLGSRVFGGGAGPLQGANRETRIGDAHLIARRTCSEGTVFVPNGLNPLKIESSIAHVLRHTAKNPPIGAGLTRCFGKLYAARNPPFTVGHRAGFLD